MLYTRRGTRDKDDDKVAVTEIREGYTEVRQVMWGVLRGRVAGLMGALRARGVRKGNRVAVVAGNSVETMVVFLAVVAVGGVFSSGSCDMGTRGILDRLWQIEPKVREREKICCGLFSPFVFVHVYGIGGLADVKLSMTNSTCLWMIGQSIMARRSIFEKRCAKSQRA